MNKPLIPKVNVMLHGGDYNPDQWLDRPDILARDLELMKQAHVNCVSLGIFAWAALEPEEGVFTFEWMDKIIDNLWANGVYVILATPTGAMPRWMAQKYPEIRRVMEAGHRRLYGDRHDHCYTSPIYREKMQIINTKLAERYSHHPAVILWHLSNEYGGDCRCPLCAEAFRGWLKEKYGTLENLNRSWWTAFWSHQVTDWSQIDPPEEMGDNIVHAHNLDWKRFVTHQTVDFCRAEAAAVKAVNPDLPVTTNFMGIYEGLDYFKFDGVLDLASWDSYPLWNRTVAPNGSKVCQDPALGAQISLLHDVTRGTLRKPFLLMESTPSMTNWQPISKLKRPGMHKLASTQAVAHGSNSVQYFQWRKGRGSYEKFHGAVVDHYGEADTRVFRDVAEVGDYLEKSGTTICDTPVKSKIALIYDWECRWAVKDAAGPRNMAETYLPAVMDHYRALWEKGVNVDIVNMDGNLDGYDLVVAPQLYMLRNGFGEKLNRFVEEGGTLVTTYWSGIVDDTDLCFLGGFPGVIGKTLGLRSEEIDALYDGEENSVRIDAPIGAMQGKSYRAFEMCDLIHPSTAETLGCYEQDFYAGRAALCRNRYGKGTAYYIAARCEAAFFNDLYDAVLAECGIEPFIADLPEGVTARARGENNEILFVMNFNNEAVTVEIPFAARDLISGETVGGKTQLKPYEVITLIRG